VIVRGGIAYLIITGSHRKNPVTELLYVDKTIKVEKVVMVQNFKGKSLRYYCVGGRKQVIRKELLGADGGFRPKWTKPVGNRVWSIGVKNREELHLSCGGAAAARASIRMIEIQNQTQFS
jgi:hypothetical protein